MRYLSSQNIYTTFLLDSAKGYRLGDIKKIISRHSWCEEAAASEHLILLFIVKYSNSH